MICPNCGTKLRSKATLCKKCGIKVSDKDNKPVFSDIKEEELVKAFIGNNYKTIIEEKLNWSCIVFGLLYISYRRYWALFLVSYLSMVALTFIFKSEYYCLIPWVLCGIIFNKSYLSYAKKSVKRIREKNKDASSKELISLCTFKGKPSIFAVLVAIVGFRLIYLLLQYLLVWGIS